MTPIHSASRVSLFRFSRIREIKRFYLRRRANHWHWSAQPAPPRGTLRGRHETWRGLRWMLWREVIFSPGETSAAYGEVVWFWRRDRGVYPPCLCGAGNGDNKRRSPGRARISRQTIARGKPGCLGCTCQTRVRFFLPLHTVLRAQSAPGFPCALCLEEGQRI